MDDLISRSALINKIRAVCPGSQDIDFVCKLIEEQPTAYNMDKVVEEIKALPQHSTWNHNSDNIERKKTIEIVERGGIDGK